MESIFYATDLHLTDKQPINRITPVQPSGLEAFKKLLVVAENAPLILGGDLFESPCPSYGLFNSVVKLLKMHNGEVFTIFGNHDILYADATVENNALTALINMGLIKLLGFEPVKLAGFDVYGVSYTKTLYSSFSEIGLKIKNPQKSIVATHQFMSDMKLPYNHIMLNNFNAENVAIVLCGHLHRQFQMKFGNTEYLNTGCVCKLNRNEASFNASYGIINDSGDMHGALLNAEIGIEFMKKQRKALIILI